MDMSNKSLALLLTAAIIISLGGALISLNQLQIGPIGLVTGQVNISVQTNASCTIDSNVSFGSSGQVLSATTISTNSTNALTNFTNCVATATCQGMQVNNTGNVNVNVTFNSTEDGATFLGTAASDFQFNVYNGTAASQTVDPGCRAAVGLPAAWATVPTAATKICNNLTADDAYDVITIEYNITLYPTTPPGVKSTDIVVACAQN